MSGYFARLFRTGERLSELLSRCDYVCNVLPSTAQTDGLLDGPVADISRFLRFFKMAAAAIFTTAILNF